MVITYRLLFKFLTSRTYNRKYSCTQMELAKILQINQSNISSTMNGKKPIQYIKVKGKNIRIVDNSDILADIIASHIEKKMGTRLDSEYIVQWHIFLTKAVGSLPKNIQAAFDEYFHAHQKGLDLHSFLKVIFKEAEKNRDVIHQSSALSDEEKALLRKLSLAAFEGVQRSLLPELFKGQADISLIPHLVTTGWIHEDKSIDASQDRIRIPLSFCHILQSELKPDDCRNYLQEIPNALDPSHSPRLKYSLAEIDDLCRILANAFHFAGKEYVPQIDTLWEKNFALLTPNQKSEAEIYKKIIRLYDSIYSANNYYEKKANIFDIFGELYLTIPTVPSPGQFSRFNLRSWSRSFLQSLQMMSYATVSYEKSFDFYQKCHADPLTLALTSFHLGIARIMAAGQAALVSRFYINDEDPENLIADPDDYLKKAAEAFADGLQILSVIPGGEEIPDFPLTLSLDPTIPYSQISVSPSPSGKEILDKESSAKTRYNEGMEKFRQKEYIGALTDFEEALEIYAPILSSADRTQNPFHGIIKVMKNSDLLKKTADVYQIFKDEMERRKELATNAGEKKK